MAKLFINPNVKLSRINKDIYGHFSEHLGRCIYEGIYVGENSEIPNKNGMRCDVVEALKKIKIPVLRWPGGCFADEYHWQDGIGPKNERKKMINTHWGGVVEDNSFGTHEFMELCNQLGCDTYINGNVGSGTVREMSEWVEYMTFEGVSPMADLRAKNGHEKPWNIKYFGVGNENWGCGGNMTPEFYANEYRRYQTYVRNYSHNDSSDNSESSKKKIYKIACGPNVDDYEWTEGVMKVAHKYMDGISLHYYVHPHGWKDKGSATVFNNDDWYITMQKAYKMDELIKNHTSIMNRYDPEGKIGLIVDEWGSWYECEPGTNPGFLYQQNTMRDALIAGITLNIFNKHSDRVKMANIAQMVNVLQAVILTEGAKMILTPTYHVFDMYKAHQDSELVESYIEAVPTGISEDCMVNDLCESVSIKDNVLTATITNLSLDNAKTVDVILSDTAFCNVSAQIITGAMNAHNTFDEPENIKLENFSDFTTDNGKITLTIPAVSVVSLTVNLK